MKNTYGKVMSTLLVTLTIVSTVILSVGASATTEPQAPQSLQSMRGGAPIFLRWDSTPSSFRVPPPPQASRLGAQSAMITMDYKNAGTQLLGYNCYTWPDEAKTAFSYAASIWSSLINSDVPTEIAACWTDMSPGILGGSATVDWYRNFAGAPLSNVWYYVSLANALYGSDINDNDSYDTDGDGSDADPETYIVYNRNYNWYYGTDGNTPPGQMDFASVVLHEIGHSLGFAGSMKVDNGTGSPECNGTNGVGCWSGPLSYDYFAEDSSSVRLLDYTSPSTALGNTLTGQGTNVYFDGTNARAANGGTPPQLYTPSTWSSGSSYSHLDYATFNDTENELMVWALSSGESVHHPGPVVLGMLKDMGWPTPPDLCITQRVAEGGLGYDPGDPITLTLSIENIGGDIATGVVVTDELSSDILTPTFETSLATITATGTISYVWELPNLAIDASGAITIYGTIRDSLPSDFAIWNTASISTDASEDDTSNNSHTILVGGYRVYLPLILNNYG